MNGSSFAGGRRLVQTGAFGNAVNPSLEAPGAPSLARTVPKAPVCTSLLSDVGGGS